MIRLRPATLSDSEYLFRWRNYPSTYAAFRQPRPVTRDEHNAYMEMILGDPEKRVLIADKESDRIGMVRFCDRDNAAEVSITIAPAFRQQNLGYLVLYLATKDVQIPLFAEIKRDNIASRRIFEQCHFEELGGDGDFILYRRWPE